MSARRSLVTHIGLLRGINVGGRKPVAMANLRALPRVTARNWNTVRKLDTLANG